MGRFLSFQQVHLLIIFKHFYLHVVFALPLGVLIDLCDAFCQAGGGESVGNANMSMYFYFL